MEKGQRKCAPKVRPVFDSGKEPKRVIACKKFF